MSRCQGSWFGHHRFKPRYDDKMPEWLSKMGGFEGTKSTIEAVKEHIYVRDVCVRCGDVIEREKRE